MGGWVVGWVGASEWMGDWVLLGGCGVCVCVWVFGWGWVRACVVRVFACFVPHGRKYDSQIIVSMVMKLGRDFRLLTAW